MRRAILLGLLLPGCSLLGLDQLTYEECTDNDQCNQLNTSHPTGDPCLSWQCNQANHHCEKSPRDADGDGVPPMECAPMGVTPDCDDDNPLAFPQPEEPPACDGVDNDCDGFPDDGRFGPMEPTLLAAGAAGETSYAVRPGEAGAAVTFVGPMNRPHVLQIAAPRSGSTPEPVIPLTFDLAAGTGQRGRVGTVSRGSALAALPAAGEFAFAYVESSGCQRPLVGLLTPATRVDLVDGTMENAFPLEMDVTHYERGFADDQGLHCVRTPCTPHVDCREGPGSGPTQECEGTTCLQPCTRDNMCEDRAPVGGTRGPEDERCVCPPCPVSERFCVMPTRACMPGMICPVGETCIGGNCRLPCVDDTGCTRAGDSCGCRFVCPDTEKRCEDSRGDCEPNTLCPAGETCEPDSVMEDAFHCQRACTADTDCPDAGETCDTTAGRCVSAGRNLGARMISVATADRAILVAYARDNTPMRDGCPAPPVGLRLGFAYRDGRATRPAGEPPIVALPTPALPVGTTEDTAPPALLGIPGFGFIVAFVDEMDNIVFRHVTIEPMGATGPYAFTLEPDPLLTIPPLAMPAVDDADRGHISLVVGETAGGVITIGLGYRSGCAIDADTFLRLLTLDTGAGTLAPLTMPAQVPDGDRIAERHPSIAFNAETDVWLVVAERGSETVDGRRFVVDDAMAIIFPPEDPYTFLPATTDPVPNVSQAPFAFPATTTFGIIAHLTRDTENMTAFYGSDLACLMEAGPMPDAGM